MAPGVGVFVEARLATQEKKTLMANGKSRWENLTGRVGELVRSHPGKIVLLFLSVTILMTIPMKRIDTSTKMSDYLPGHEYADTDAILRRKFESTYSVVSILQAKSSNILDRQGLNILLEMEQAILSTDQLKPFLIDYDDSVVTVADAVEAVLFSLSSGLYGLDDAPDDLLEEAISDILDDDNASSLVSVGSGSEREYAIILAHFNHNLIPRDDESADVALLETMQNHVPDGYHLTSIAARNTQMEQDSKEGLRILLPISLSVVCFILVVTLRSLVDFLICIVSLVSVLIISFGTFALLGLQSSQITFFAPIVIVVLAIDYAIHLILRYREFKKRELEAPLAISKAIRHTGVSILFSALTTVVAFGSNGLSSIPAVASFGFFMAIGLSVSFVVMILLVPALKLLHLQMSQKTIARMRERQHQKDRWPSSRLDAEQAQIGWPGPASVLGRRLLNSLSLAVVLIALAACGGGVILAKHIEKDVTSEDVYAFDSLVLHNQRILHTEFPSIGMDRARIVIEADVCAPEVLKALNESISNMANDQHVAQLEGKAKVSSIIPYVQETVRLQRNVSAITDVNNDRLPDTRRGLSRILARLYDQGVDGVASAGQVKSLLGRGQEQRLFDATLLIAETRDTHGTNVGRLIAELDDDLRPLTDLGGVKISYAGFVFDRYKIITAMTDGMTKATFVSILLCTIIVTLLFMSLRFGVITALPIILITGWMLGTMYVFAFTLNMITATITAMGVGIGIDYSIHLMERYRQERYRGRAVTESMSQSLRATGPSLLAAAATTVSGFLVLAFAKIGMVKSFGILASLVIVYALVSSAIVLPAILVGSKTITVWLKNKRS